MAAVWCEQPATLAPHRLGDEKPLPVWDGERGGMELDVLGIDDACPGPEGHRQPVTPCTVGIGRVPVDAAQSPGRQHGRPCQVAVDGPL